MNDNQENDLSGPIVITGIGAVTPIGVGKENFWRSLTNGTSGISEISRFDVSGCHARTAAEVKDFDSLNLLVRKQNWSGSRSITFAVAGAKLALEDAGIELTETTRAETGVVFGTTLGCVNLMAEFDRQSIREGPRSCDPGMFPDTGVSAPSCRISVLMGFSAFNSTLSNGASSGLDALSYAARALRAGKARAVLVGGVEEISYETFLACYSQSLLSSRKDGKDERCRPFDRRRNGIVLGEGCAVLVLEELSAAQARGARVYAELAGYGSSFDPWTRPPGTPTVKTEGRAMKGALKSSGLAPAEIDFVSCSANSSRPGDRREALAIFQLFGRRSLFLTAIKSMLGESYSAAGAMQVAAAALSLYHGKVTPTIACSEPDPRCAGGTLVSQSQQRSLRAGMINAFGCNGSCASVILRSLAAA